MALVIRLELWAPGLQVVDNPEQFNEMFTMHGTIMLLLFATPAFAAFANALMPLQILSGGMTPRESMPELVQHIMLAAPTTHFIELAQAILFRGAGV